MLGRYEERHFDVGEKIWMGTYKNLTNILHWHSECELIRIINGVAEIKIGNELFNATQGDCFFCSAEEMHYISSKSETIIEVMIFHKDLLCEITNKYSLSSALLSDSDIIGEKLNRIYAITLLKPRFYNETIENRIKELILYIYNNNEICLHQSHTPDGKKFIEKINRDFATVTFDELVAFSGYSSSHFSKVFKKHTGMTFSDYLNYVKTEHAIPLLQNNTGLNITDICFRCGFSTIRNFNRVFKQITGYTPKNLPKDFVSDLNINIYAKDRFDPTSQTSVLLK